MFGYTIKIVKKEELQECELFRKTVYHLNQQCNGFVKWLYNEFDMNSDSVSMISMNVECLSTLVELYFNNKYSAPANSMQMFRAIDSIRKHTANIIETVNMFLMVNEKAANMEPELYESNEINEEISKHRIMSITRVKADINSITNFINLILVMIEHDLVKSLLGVDIIKEYKKRQKRILKDKELSTEFEVKFKAITPSDHDYMEKEKYKCNQTK